MGDCIEIGRGGRDYSPEIHLFVAEYGEDHYSDEFDLEGRLAFHTLDEAKEWLRRNLHEDHLDFDQLDSRTWRAEVDYGPWAEVRKSRITQPQRLLRDDRENSP